jgi:hypothetical protein
MSEPTDTNLPWPSDIKPPWMSVTRRMQSVSKTEGFAVVTINVLVGPDGCPKAWLEPRVYRIEPKRLALEGTGLPPQALLAALAKGEDL